MKKGISLHIGLNYVDPNHYSDWNGELAAAEFDANDMCLIAKSRGFQTTKLLREEATRNSVIGAISQAASTLALDDIFLVSYSGHGGQLPDVNGDESDDADETWCLYDGQLIDDELAGLWAKFKPGVRILVFSDSCHSGTVLKVAGNIERTTSEFIPKYMPRNIAISTYSKNKVFYDQILENTKDVPPRNILASVKLISGCQDDQKSYDGTFNGQFTKALKKIWNGGKFSGNYAAFHRQIMDSMPTHQTPNYYNIGQSNINFDNQKPFSI